MRKRLALLSALLSVPAPVFAAHGMVVVVEPAQIRIGAVDTVPRFLNLPTTLLVPAGTEATLPADSTWDYIEVAGTLHCSRTRNTIVRVTHFFILPGGVSDCGSSTDPIPATNRVEIVIRNVPIDAKDVFQWGNGLINFGKQSRVGSAKLPWAAAVGDVRGISITLAVDPTGWAVGDELLIPDTRRTAFPSTPRRESKVTIVAISGRVVTLSKTLDFEHLALRDPDNNVVLTPRVVNLSRNIVVRSEDPTGTPGHSADVGADASWDVRYNELVGLGRTKNTPLNSVANGVAGTNQVGRYADHHHHVGGGWQSWSVGNVLRGFGYTGKWGYVIHGTHDVPHIDDNIADGFTGSGFVTEDGYEVRNVFKHNFSAYQLGNHLEDLNCEFTATAQLNAPGTCGNGYWHRGVKNSWDSNEAWNNSIGFNIFNQNQVGGMYPSVPGGEHDTTYTPGSSAFGAFPVLAVNNVTSGNVHVGFEQWNSPTYPNRNVTCGQTGVTCFFQGVADISGPWLVNPTFFGTNGEGFGIHNNTAYTTVFKIDGGRIVGFEQGGHGGLGHFVYITNTIFQNKLNLEFLDTPDEYVLDSVAFKPFGSLPLQYVVMGDPGVWSPPMPLPDNGTSWWFNQRGSRLLWKNYQNTGQDYRVFNRQQFGSTLAWPATGFMFPHAFNCPAAGITMLRCWLDFGMAYRGETAPDADLLTLPGLINGWVLPGLKATLGVPKGIVTTPNPREAAHVESDGHIRGWAILTGDYTAASNALLVSVDGGPMQVVGPRDGDPQDLREFPITATAPGTHTIESWRAAFTSDVPNQPVPATRMQWTYIVGSTPPPPDCRPPQINVGGVCVDPPPPVDACPNLAGNQPTVPADRVLVNGQCLCKPGTVDQGGVCVVPTPVVSWRFYLGSASSGAIRQKLIDNVPTNEYRMCTGVVQVALKDSAQCDQIALVK